MSSKNGRLTRKIDGKYYAAGNDVYSTRTGKPLPADEPLFLLRAQDKVAIRTLIRYKQECKIEGCKSDQLSGVQATIDAFIAWQAAHPEQMKLPDAAEPAPSVAVGKDRRYGR